MSRKTPTCPACGGWADGWATWNHRRYRIHCGADLDDPEAPPLDWEAPVAAERPHDDAGDGGSEPARWLWGES